MIRLLARHPTAGNLLMAALSLVGLVAVLGLRRESLPQVALSEVEVSVVHPGASAEEVEEGICRPLEDALAGVPFVEELRAEALEGRGVVTAEMTESGDFDTFQAKIQAEVDALTSLPDDAEAPVVEVVGDESKVLALLVTSPGSDAGLKAYCEDLDARLRRLPEVSLVEIQGFGPHQFRVELDPEALARHDLGVVEVASVLAAQSLDRPGGTIESDERDLLVRFVERRRSPEELEDLVILATASGTEVRLGELGRVVELFDDDSRRVELDGGRAGRLEISKTRAEDSLAIADAVRAFVDEERERAPAGVELYLTEDSSTNLRGQIDLVVTNGWQGMVLVALSMWLFFTLRLAVWVVSGLPVSVLGACIFMPGLDLTVNMLTLVGFLLALGLLMDDAIVIAENVATHRARGKSALQAAIDGTSEVKTGVFASFLTTVCVLGPLATLGGDIGQVLRVVPIVLILVMAVSLVEAFGILPGHLAHALHHTPRPSRFRAAFERFVDLLRERVVGALVDRALRHRYAFLGVVLGVFVACIGLFASKRLPFQALPDLEGDVIVARVLLPQGAPLARTGAVVDEVLRGLAETNAEWSPRQPDGAPLVLGSHVRFGVNADAFESGPHVATVSVDLRTAQERVGRIDDYLATWRERTGAVSDAVELLFAKPSAGASGRPIEIRLSGENLEELARAGEELRAELQTYDGTRNLLSDLRRGKPELRLTLREGARGLGFDADAVAREVSAAYRGVTADELQLGADTYEIDVRLARGARDSVADLERLELEVPTGGRTRLAAVADVEEGRGWSRIARVDGWRTVTVRGDVDTTRGNTASILRAVERDFLPGLLERHPGVRIELAGEAAESAETQGSMVSRMLLGLAGVFVLLSFQFRSYVEPLVVMMAIPLSLIGVVLGHRLLDFPFTLPGMLGFISLAGVVVNDSILLVEFVKIERRAGRTILEAAAQASRSRFRAVLLTSATTIVGLLPLLAETSLQAQLLKGLVISVSFGLMASTVLVLFVVPCLYSVLGDLGLATRAEEAEDDEEEGGAASASAQPAPA